MFQQKRTYNSKILLHKHQILRMHHEDSKVDGKNNSEADQEVG